MTYPAFHDVEGERERDPLSYAVAERDRHVLDMVRTAVETGNVMLAFQPVVPRDRPDRPAFYEGLIRILDASGRIIPARDFIAEVETRELGRRIDCLALEFGLQVLRRQPRLRLSINMSARSIGYPAWMRTFEDGLAQDPTVGERLILEITESSAIVMPDLVESFMNSLQLRGISFAIDDFGSGYTSMKYLKDLYFDILKVDGQFVRGIARDPDNQALMRAMVSIGRHFEMVVVAESVETAEDARMLAEIGVDCMQGYYFGAPTIRPRWDVEGARTKAG